MTGLRWRFDADRCTGCEACVLGCWMENRAIQTVPWRKVRLRPGDWTGPRFHDSLACHHCDHPACMEHCPADAYRRDPATGAVLVDGDRCIGCRYCTWACPYGAPAFSAATGTVEKCTFCAPRLAEGLAPACAARCPVDALGVEPREGRGLGAAPADFPDLGLDPGIRFVAPRRVGPACSAPPDPATLAAPARPEPRITLRGEWSLALFTLALSTLAGFQLAAAAGAPPGHPWLLALLGPAALALSTAHLGRPLRAWRALLNLRGSWLSREVALAGAFLALGGLALLAPGLAGLAWAAAAAGVACLFAVDRVYEVLPGCPKLHSAQALLNGLALAAVLTGDGPATLALVGLKLGLYLVRKARARGAPLPATLLRTALALAALVPGPWAWAALLAGDAVDRAEFYSEIGRA